MNVCIACAAECHEECYKPVQEVVDNLTVTFCCCPEGEIHVEGKDGRGRRELSNSDVTDVLSTGRKRAAKAYPLTEGLVCEWRELRSAGGGVVPIIGCVGGFATDRHHGPDKNTLNNEPGNVHRICSTCHNRWHAANDEYYGKRPDNGQRFIPQSGSFTQHDGETKATPQEILDNEMLWAKRKISRVSHG